MGNATKSRATPLDGLKFGQLSVLGRAPSPGFVTDRGAYWLCRCTCGNEKVVSANNLASGHTVSCGCHQKRRAGDSARSRFTTHGQSRPGNVASEYRIWTGIIARCENPASRAFPRYGGRGIGICDEWRNSFPTFLAAVGPRPSNSHTLDRIDNDRGYEPGNVRWATAAQQSRNRRDRRPITFGGRTMLPTDWCNLTGLRLKTLLDRIYKRGWSIESALTTPPHTYHHKRPDSRFTQL